MKAGHFAGVGAGALGEDIRRRNLRQSILPAVNALQCCMQRQRLLFGLLVVERIPSMLAELRSWPQMMSRAPARCSSLAQEREESNGEAQFMRELFWIF